VPSSPTLSNQSRNTFAHVGHGVETTCETRLSLSGREVRDMFCLRGDGCVWLGCGYHDLNVCGLGTDRMRSGRSGDRHMLWFDGSVCECRASFRRMLLLSRSRSGLNYKWCSVPGSLTLLNRNPCSHSPQPPRPHLYLSHSKETRKLSQPTGSNVSQ
jgi:hypothetical protein